MKDAVIIGKGMVGKATMHSLGIKDYYSRSSTTVKLDEIHKFKYIFLCVPTPTINGECDISLLDWYIGEISRRSKDPIFIIRSTVIPGTCDKLAHAYGVKIVHVPEFLSEDTWKEDSEWPDLTVIGYADINDHNQVMAIFKARFKGTQFVSTDLKTAETIKYAINSFYALKVVYANEVYDYCQDKGMNYDTVKNAMYSRKWIGKNHLDVINKGGRGAGGKCLRKDLDAFANETCSDLLLEANRINQMLLVDYPKDVTETY